MHQIYDYMQQIEDKEVVLLGLGREGLSSYAFIRKYLPTKHLWLVDEKKRSELDEIWGEIAKTDENITFANHLEHSELQEASGIIIIKTPGIAPHKKLAKQATELKANVTSNTNIFFTILDIINANLPSERLPVKTIGVTGTKGKSTATSVISHVLTTAGLHTFLGGNIGIAPLSLIEQIIDAAEQNETQHPVFAVLELSCHQLNDAYRSPNYAVLLDITPEHLDYYKTFDKYVQAKSQICRFQTENDFVILDSHAYIPKKIAHLGEAQQLTFGYNRNIHKNWITVGGEQIADLDTLPFTGKHTTLNALPAVILAKHLEIANEVIAQGLKSFKTLPHRLELIEERGGVSYYNDSLSTTPVATIAAIQSFHNAPIILIAGGFDRGLDYSELAQSILNHNVKHLILMPDTGEIIEEEIEKRLTNNMGELTVTHTESMQQAVQIAHEHSEDGDVVLMSPASASFNLFKNYQDRGDQFRKFVAQL